MDAAAAAAAAVSAAAAAAAVNIIIFACVCGALFFLACVIGSLCAKWDLSTMKGTLPSRGGCCSTGCCSVYASRGWALTTDCAAIFMLGGGFLLYTAMTSLQANIVCIIEGYLLAENAVSFLLGSSSSFSSIFSLVDPIRPVLNLLNIFVAIPAALSALFMFLQSMCALNAKDTNNCSSCSKLFLLITYVWIILSFIVGVIAAALAPAVQLPMAQPYLAPITGTCDTLPALRNATAAATAAGMASNVTQVEAMGNMCVCATSFIDSAVNLFGPGICNIIVAIFAMYASCCQCWTEGCCVRPKTAKATHITCCGWLFCLCGGCCWGRAPNKVAVAGAPNKGAVAGAPKNTAPAAPMPKKMGKPIVI